MPALRFSSEQSHLSMHDVSLPIAQVPTSGFHGPYEEKKNTFHSGPVEPLIIARSIPFEAFFVASVHKEQLHRPVPQMIDKMTSL
jgi:hypothetical protein